MVDLIKSIHIPTNWLAGAVSDIINGVVGRAGASPPSRAHQARAICFIDVCPVM